MNATEFPTDLQDLMDHHGHLCFGVLLGYKACKYAVEIIGQGTKMVVITESENCSTDAVNVLLNCTVDNGRLICRASEKKERMQAWAFYNCDEEEGVRLTVNTSLAAHLPKEKDAALMQILKMSGNMLFVAQPFMYDCID